MKVQKALLVKPNSRPDWDIGDVLAVARSLGKKLFKTSENVRVIWAQESPYGYVVIVEAVFQGNLKSVSGQNTGEVSK